jgi:signal transduction histidine kinase
MGMTGTSDAGPTDETNLTEKPPAAVPGHKKRQMVGRAVHYPSNSFKSWLSRTIGEENIFLFLVGLRWLGLLPPALALWLHPTPGASQWLIFALAVTTTSLLTVFQEKLNRLVIRHPALLLLDMSLCAVFIALSGGTSSPYERYARMPLLAASFFFLFRGGLIGAAAFTPLYVSALFVAYHYSGAASVNQQEALTEIVSFFWFSLIFAYPAVLLQRLRAATAQLHTAQQEAARAETLAVMGKMAAHVSHEIRNPLVTIGGFARAVLRRPDDEGRVRKNVHIIVDEVERLEQLLTDMLDLARPPAAKRRPENLHDILDKAWLLAGGVIQDNPRIILRKSYGSKLPPLEADAASLLRAFLNVLRNAVQMMPEGGTVTITTCQKTDEVEISIADTGPGIEPEMLTSVFAPFISARPNGTGLGLAVTQRIIHEHGGRIEVQSEPGQGAKFIFHLPLEPLATPAQH